MQDLKRLQLGDLITSKAFRGVHLVLREPYEAKSLAKLTGHYINPWAIKAKIWFSCSTSKVTYLFLDEIKEV